MRSFTTLVLLLSTTLSFSLAQQAAPNADQSESKDFMESVVFSLLFTLRRRLGRLTTSLSLSQSGFTSVGAEVLEVLGSLALDGIELATSVAPAIFSVVTDLGVHAFSVETDVAYHGYTAVTGNAPEVFSVATALGVEGFEGATSVAPEIYHGVASVAVEGYSYV